MNPRGVIVIEDGQSANGHRRSLEALEHIANRPIADHVLETLESAGVQEVVIAASEDVLGLVKRCFEGESHPGLRISYRGQPAPLDVAGALRLAAPMIEDRPCIVHLADGLLGEPWGPSVMPVELDTPDIVLMVHQSSAPEEHLSPATQDMLCIAELNPERTALGMAGVWMFGPGAIHHVGSAPWRSGGEIDLTMIAERIAGAGGRIQFRVVDSWHRYGGDPSTLLELNQIALDRLAVTQRRSNGNGNGHGPGNADGTRIEGRVQIDASASVRASVIVGPTVIGPGARVSDAYIGPYTSIGAGARIEGAEIERSIIAPGASITHIGGRLVSSVVGRDARIFRDFSLPRALRLRVGDGTEVSLC